MDVSGSILIKWHRLQQNVVVSDGQLLRKINDFVNRPLYLEGIWIHLLANFTFKTLPVKRSDVLILGIWRLFLFLSEDPIFQALEMDETNSSSTFTCNNKWIF